MKTAVGKARPVYSFASALSVPRGLVVGLGRAANAIDGGNIEAKEAFETVKGTHACNIPSSPCFIPKSVWNEM